MIKPKLTMNKIRLDLPFIWIFQLRLLIFSIAIVLPLAGCGQPNPVDDSQDPTYIPFADTSFLIPRKIWLKGYGRKSTDGKVSSISLHTLAPNVEPWSPEVNDQMYGKPGWQDEINIVVRGSTTVKATTEKRIIERGFKLTESTLFENPAIKFYERTRFKIDVDIYIF